MDMSLRMIADVMKEDLSVLETKGMGWGAYRDGWG
jgi:hypothetical protein